MKPLVRKLQRFYRLTFGPFNCQQRCQLYGVIRHHTVSLNFLAVWSDPSPQYYETLIIVIYEVKLWPWEVTRSNYQTDSQGGYFKAVRTPYISPSPHPTSVPHSFSLLSAPPAEKMSAICGWWWQICSLSQSCRSDKSSDLKRFEVAWSSSKTLMEDRDCWEMHKSPAFQVHAW